MAAARDDERERLVERIITAEQDERRRLALFLHDGPVQNHAGIALMLDAAMQAIDEGRAEAARGILASAVDRSWPASEFANRPSADVVRFRKQPGSSCR